MQEVLKALIVVKGSLDKPYPERPEWSPWSRWVEKAFHQGAAAEEVARLTLRRHNGGLAPLEDAGDGGVGDPGALGDGAQ